MVNFSVSKKQSKASGSARPTRSGSTIKDLTPSTAASNHRGIFDDHDSYNEAIKIIIKFLSTYPLFGAFYSFNEVVRQDVLFKCAFFAFRPNDKPQEIHLCLIEDSLVILSKEKFLEAINL